MERINSMSLRTPISLPRSSWLNSLGIRTVQTTPTIWTCQAIQTVTVFGLAFALRVIALGTRSLWYDEAFAVLFSEKGFDAMLYGTLAPTGGGAADVHPLLYYTSLWAWMILFGQSAVVVRLLGVFAGMVTLALAHRLARDLMGKRAAVVGSLFLAVSPFLVHYSQEARMYSFLALWLTAATWAYLRAMRAEQRGSSPAKAFALFAVLAALAQYTHHLAALYLVALALTPVWLKRWKLLGRSALAGLLAALLYLPWLVNAPSQLAKLQSAYWTVRPGPAQLVATLTDLTANLPLRGAGLALGLFVALLTTALGIYQAVIALVANRERMPRSAYQERMEFAAFPRENGFVWLLYLGLFPILLMFLVSQVQPVYVNRALIGSGVMYLLGLSWGLTRSGLPRVIAAAMSALLVLVAVVGLHSHYTYSNFPNSPFAQLDAYLRAALREEDVIVHSNKLSFFSAHFYDRALPQSFLGDPSGSGSDTLAYATQQALGLYAFPDLERATEGSGRVWFVIFERAILEYQAQGAPTHPHLDWLSRRFTLAGRRSFNDLWVYEYTR